MTGSQRCELNLRNHIINLIFATLLEVGCTLRINLVLMSKGISYLNSIFNFQYQKNVGSTTKVRGVTF